MVVLKPICGKTLEWESHVWIAILALGNTTDTIEYVAPFGALESRGLSAPFEKLFRDRFEKFRWGQTNLCDQSNAVSPLNSLWRWETIHVGNANCPIKVFAWDWTNGSPNFTMLLIYWVDWSSQSLGKNWFACWNNKVEFLPVVFIDRKGSPTRRLKLVQSNAKIT